MKNVYKFFILVVFALFTSTGCEKIKDINTISFEPTFSTDLDCVVPASGKAPLIKSFSSSGKINPQDDEDVKKYLKKIRKYEIKSITGTITSISPNNATLLNGSLVIKNSQFTSQWAVQNVPLVVGQSITLGNSNGEWDNVNNILKDGQEFTVMASGETDKGGIQFTINVEIEAKVSAKVI